MIRIVISDSTTIADILSEDAIKNEVWHNFCTIYFVRTNTSAQALKQRAPVRRTRDDKIFK